MIREIELEKHFVDIVNIAETHELAMEWATNLLLKELKGHKVV